MTLDNPLLSAVGMLCLAFAAACAGGERARRLGASGLLVLGLALAAWGAGSPPGDSLTSPARLGRGFLVGNGGLLLLGSVLVCGAAVHLPPGRGLVAARLLTGAGLVLLAPTLVAFLAAAGPLRAAGAGLALGLLGIFVAHGARAIASLAPVRLLARRLVPPPLVAHRPEHLGSAGVLVLLLGFLATALGPHVGVVFAGLIAAAWAAYLTFHPPGDRPVPVAPVLTLLLLGPLGLLAAISGPLGLRIAILPVVPMSPAAELLVAPLLLLAAWAVAGLWPLQRQLPGAVLAPAGALLLARVAIPVAPDGVDYLRPLTAPLVLLGLWNAALFRRWPLLLAGAGFYALAMGSPEATAAAALLASGFALELCAVVAVPHAAASIVGTAAWPVAAWSGMRMLEGALRGQVVYTALGTLGLALIIATTRASHAR